MLGNSKTDNCGRTPVTGQQGHGHRIIHSYTFSKNHSCPLWTDYELTCYELEEANSLSHSNWIEIERQYKYIQTLQKILSDNDIPYPNEYDFD